MFPVSRFRSRFRTKTSGQFWTPAQLNTSLWLDAADTSTVTLNGANVSQWNDKSGKSINVLQATATSQPAYEAAGLNGKPSILFDGVDDSLISSANLGITGNPLFTVVTVQTVVTATASRVFVSFGATPAGQGYHWMMGTAVTDVLTGFTNSVQVGTATFSPFTTPFISVINRTSTVNSLWAMRKNGTVIPSGTPNSLTVNLANGPVHVGKFITASNYSNLRVGELLIVPSSLTGGEMELMEGYLAWKWGGF